MNKKSLVGIRIFIIALIIFSMIGCSTGRKGNEGDSTVDKPKVENTKEGKEDDIVDEKRDIIEISIALWDLQDFGMDEMGEFIEGKLDIKIKEVNLSWDTDTEQIKLFAATQDMPDCIATYTISDPTRFYGWIDQGLTRSIPAEMLDDYPLVKKVMEDSRCLQAVKDIKGEYYFIPRPESAANLHIANQSVIYYRMDWADNVGFKNEPETMDDYYMLLKAFTEQDPDGNGKNDTIGLTLAGGLPSHLFTPYGVDPGYWIEEDGRFIPGYMSKKCIEPLKFYQKLYREGILDPEFAKNGYKEAIGKLAKNTAGSMIRNGDTAWLKGTIKDYYGEANEDKGDPIDIMGVMGPLKKDASSDPAWSIFVSTCGTEISSNVNDEKLKRILELDEFMLSPEGRDLFRWGFEGVDFERDGDDYKSLLGEDETLRKKYPSHSLKPFSDWDFDFISIPPGDPKVPLEYKELGDRVREKYNPWARDERLDITYLSTPAKDGLTILSGEAFTQIVTGPDDVEKAFEVFIQDCINKGVEKAIAEVNELANK